MLNQLSEPGDHVEIELDIQERDRYGRLLGYVWLPDGRMLNEEIVRAGYAGLMTYPPNVRHLRTATGGLQGGQGGEKRVMEAT